MLVIVPQTWHQESTLRIYDLSVRSWLDIGVRPDANNPFAAHDDSCCRRDAKITRIEQPRVTNDEVATRNVRQCAGDALRPGNIGFLLRVAQLRDRRLGSIRHNRKPGRYGCGCALMI